MAARIKFHHILFAGFTLISMVPVIILALWVYQSAVDREFAAVRDKHLLLAHNLTGALSRYAQDVRMGVRMALDHIEMGTTHAGALPEMLGALNLRHVCIIDPSGQIENFVQGFGAPPQDAGVRRVMEELADDVAAARANPDRIFFSNVRLDAHGAPTLFLFQALPNGRIGLAALATDYFVQVQRAITFGNKGHAAIVDRAGRVLAHPKKQWRLEMKDISAVAPVARMMKGQTGVMQFFAPATQSDMIAGYTVVPEVGWGVMIPQPVEELLQHAGQVRRVAVGIAVLGIALAGFISWWLARYLTWPIRAVANSAGEVAAGELNPRMPSLPRLAPLELRQLVGAFSQMVDEVRGNTMRLEESSARLADAQRIAQLGSWDWNIKTDKLRWSEEVYKILGIDPDTSVRKRKAYQESVHPDDLERVVEVFNNVFYKLEPMEMEHRILLPDGRERIIYHKAEIHRDSDGAPESMRGTVLDVTERRSMAALRESEERFRSLVGQAADAFFLLDEQGNIVDVNLRACESLGYSREELLARTLSDLFGGDAPVPTAELIGAVAPGSPATYLGEHQRKDGSGFPAEVRIGNIEAGGHIMFLAVSRDITERKRLEDQLLHSQKMEAIGTLAGGIAHDFNNLLFPIIGFTELTLEKLAPDSQEYADMKLVLSAAFRARDIVSQVLLFSRKSEGVHQFFDLQPILSESIKLLESTLPSEVSIQQRISREPLVVYGDSNHIHQVIVNLCMNAVQAMESGGVLSLTLDSVELDDFETTLGNKLSGEFVRIKVSDNGKGMNEDTMAHMFEPFFTTKPVGQGTGLGLSTVLGIVEQHGGGLKVSSFPGRGTHFEIFLKSESESRREDSGGPAPIPAGRESILFVDDEASTAQAGKRMLEEFGYVVTAVTSGKAAMEIFEKNADAFSLVISGQTMREMSGENLVRNLRRIRKNIPIIMCTGYSESITKEKMAELGIDGLFYKPVEPETMGNLVREVLQQSQTGMAKEA